VSEGYHQILKSHDGKVINAGGYHQILKSYDGKVINAGEYHQIWKSCDGMVIHVGRIPSNLERQEKDGNRAVNVPSGREKQE
jgi:hypothetical protein